MKRLMRLISLLLALSLCVLPAHAAEPEDEAQYFTEWSEGLDEIMAAYMEEHNLSEKNFSMGYLYTGTGEYWYFNEDHVMTAGSIYKVPLNMRITELVVAGERSYNDYVYGLPLAEAQRQSITYSKNEVSYALQRYLADGYGEAYFPAYRREMLKYSGWDESDIPDNYYITNTFTASFMLNTLTILYQDPELYSIVIDYMKDAHPGKYFRLYEDEYQIAHKYGAYEGALNDIGIIYTPTPFLLVVMTSRVTGAERILGELCQLMTEYTLSLDAKYETERQAAIGEAEALALALAEEEAIAIAESYPGTPVLELTANTESYITDIARAFACSALRFCFP